MTKLLKLKNLGLDQYILITLTLVFVIVAFASFDYGLPMHLVGDEESIIGGALKMLEQRTFIPSLTPEAFEILYYPVLTSWGVVILLAPLAGSLFLFVPTVSNLPDLQSYLLVNLDIVWLTARTLSVIAGTALVYFTYKLAQVVFEDRGLTQTGHRQTPVPEQNSVRGTARKKFINLVPFFASLLVLTSFLHFQGSIFMRHWIFSTLFFTAALYFLFKDHFATNKSALWAGLMVGLGVGISGLGFVSGFFIGLTYLVLNRNKKYWGLKQKNFWIFGAVASLLAVFFVVSNPLAFDFIVSGKDTTGLATKTAGYYLSGFAETARYLASNELVLFLIAALGAIVMWLKTKRTIVIIFVAIIALYVVFLFTFFHNASRYQLYYLPLLCIFAGYFVASLYAYIRNKRLPITAVVIVLVLLVWPVLSLVQYIRMLNTPTTEQLAYEWVQDNSSDNVFLINSRSLEFLQADEYVGWQETQGRTKPRSRAFVGQDAAQYGGQKVNYTNIYFWNDGNLTVEKITEFIDEYQPDYYLVSYSHPQELMSAIHLYLAERATRIRQYANTRVLPTGNSVPVSGYFGLGNHKLINLKRLGEYVDVYALN